MFLTNKAANPQIPLIKLKYIVIHYTANYKKGANAVANRNYFNTVKTGDNVSSHYIVDDKQIIQCLKDLHVGYHVGAKQYTTFGQNMREGTMNSPNKYTLGVEMCVNSDCDFDKMYQNTVDLVVYLLKKYNLTVDNLCRHFDITGKQCPLFMIENKDWNKFKDMVNKILNPIVTIEKPIVITKPVLRIGYSGNVVKELQENLIILGYDLKSDGIYGSITKGIIENLQNKYGLKPIDGICGKDTHALIDRLLEEKKKEIEKVVNTLGYQKIRRFDSDVHIYTTNKDEFIDVELGQFGKLETVKTIIDNKKKEGKNVVAGVNCGFFNFSAKPEHLGMYIDEGKYYYPPDGTFIDFIYFKDGRTEIVNLKDYDKVYLSKLQSETYWAIGTSYSLIQNGRINLENANKFSHSTQRNPRTLMGHRKDDTFVLVVVDGRSSKSKGVTAQQSAEIMMELGCWNGCNGDGGGSSYMIVNDKLVSVPSDGVMRRIGSAMLVCSNKPLEKPIVDYTKFPTIKLGSTNQYVKMVQKRLIELGYDLGKYGADGSFGILTDASIRSFQKSKNLVQDGVVGQNSYRELFK